MAAPSYVNQFPHAGQPTTAPTSTLGTTAAGDLLIAAVTNGGAATVPTLSGTYSGGAWTAFEGATWTTGAGGLYWSRATGNHTGQTVTCTTVNSGALTVLQLSGAIASGSPLAGSVSGTFAVSDPTLTGFTPSADECLILLAWFADDNQIASGATMGGAAMTKRSEAPSTGGTDSATGIFALAQGNLAATGDFVLTHALGTAEGHRLVGFAVQPPAPVQVGTVTDPMDDSSVAATWTDAAGVTETTQLNIATSTAFPDRRSAVSTYTLRDDALLAEVPQVASGSTTSTVLAFRDAGNTRGFRIDKYGDGNLYFGERVNSTDDLTSVTYNATDHRWWRIRHDTTANLVYWETSPDGSSWTTRRSKAPAALLASNQVRMFAGFTGADSSTTATFKNFNTPPVTASLPFLVMAPMQAR